MMRALFSMRTVLFFLYGLVLVIVLAYVRFPADDFKTYCEKSLADLLQAKECRIMEISYLFPAGVRLQGLTLVQPNGGAVDSFTMQSLKISPGGWNFWRSFDLDTSLYEGTATARIMLDWKGNLFQFTQIEGKEIELARWNDQEQSLPRKISGLLFFSGRYSGNFSTPFEGEGKGNVIVQDSAIELQRPLLTLSLLTITEAESNLHYRGRLLSVTEGKFSGRDLRGDFEGDIEFFGQKGRSALNITGNLVPQAGFFKDHPDEAELVRELLIRYNAHQLPFEMGGSVVRPTFSLAE
ncbi:type II secretion system protein GspN [Desulforhopalus singaporensis]|uniref:Type II secretion system protein N n=1 Tax=Desulforhopalus singaporensis TaxID=91360 RepID=A0A1H0M182_9BACT|nr:type II secretion system protein GspN [Desulforhopalus singaporensis]SDO74209.1 type II secretion system protein N [Desulforhopalus singaporensis]